MFASFRTRALFRDRTDAGRRLAEVLEPYCDAHSIVLGIPRGGVPVAAEVARRLGADLDIIVARELGAPGNPELGIGAVTANGGVFVDAELVHSLDVPGAYIAQAIERERGEAERREKALRGFLAELPDAGRTAVVVDDEQATPGGRRPCKFPFK
jgi:putative phosphoribosyl transferase